MMLTLGLGILFVLWIQWYVKRAVRQHDRQGVIRREEVTVIYYRHDPPPVYDYPEDRLYGSIQSGG